MKKPRVMAAALPLISSLAAKVRNSVDILLEPHVPESPRVVREYQWPDTPALPLEEKKVS